MSKTARGIGERLRALRKAHKKTQKDMAEKLGMTPAGYGKIENGDRGLSAENCIEIASYFGVTCDYLLQGDGSMENIEICERRNGAQKANMCRKRRSGLKITCYISRDECRDCDPTGWCSRYDCMCEEVHVDVIKEDGEEE